MTHYMRHSLLSTRRVISIITRNFFVTRNKQPMTIGTNRMCITRDDNCANTMCFRRQLPTTAMPHKRYKHSEHHKHDQPERLIKGTNAVNLTSAHPKHSVNNKNTVNATRNVQPQSPLNRTNAVNTIRVPPQCPINTTNTLKATKKDQPERLKCCESHKNVQAQHFLNNTNDVNATRARAPKPQTL